MFREQMRLIISNGYVALDEPPISSCFPSRKIGVADFTSLPGKLVDVGIVISSTRNGGVLRYEARNITVLD